MTQRVWMAACLLIALLGLPRTATAGLLEVILEMSGPRMAGTSVECRLDFDGKWRSCKASGAAAAGQSRVRVAADKLKQVLFVKDPDPRMWLAVAAAGYASVRKDWNVHGFEGWDVRMLSFDPMLEARSLRWDWGADSQLDWEIYHGLIGMSYNILWVQDAPTFSNAAFKVRPFGIVIPVGDKWGFDFSYDLRLYPREFTQADFGRPSVEPEERQPGTELVQSLVFGVRFKL